MLKKVIFLHLIPIFIAFSLVLLTFPFVKNHFNSKISTKTIKGKQTKISGRFANFNDGIEAEIQYIASIKNKKQLTLFGSSEFSDSAVVPYHFFPDSMSVQSLGIGHAYHQELSILIELLATHKYNKGSKICILLSPGWFEAGGTNIQAFIEFARPNFLKNILHNNDISLKYKKYIGQFIDKNRGDVENMSQEMNQFLKFSEATSVNFLEEPIKRYFKNISALDDVKYEITNSYLKPHNWSGNYDSVAVQLQQNFLKSITKNKLYVYDDYYTKYLLDENGKERFSTLEPIDFKSNKEYADFKILVEYIKERKMNASFVIIPFNPYYYKNTEVYKPLMDSITETLTKKNIPYLNMYVYDKKSYEPGVLKDVMHLGNYGWMKINKFLYHLYFKDEK